MYEVVIVVGFIKVFSEYTTVFACTFSVFGLLVSLNANLIGLINMGELNFKFIFYNYKNSGLPST